MRKFMRKSDVLHGFVATDLGETESDEDLHITISGHQENGRPMYQNITVIYFGSKEKADRFRYSPEDVSIHDNSKLCAYTYCEVDYFRKDPADFGSQQLKSLLIAITASYMPQPIIL